MCTPFISHCDHQAAAEALRGAFIAKGTSVTWPPRSTNLTPPAFYLWSHVKEKTYKREPRNLTKLKAAVTECGRAVTARECRRVLAELRRRVEICLARNGDILINCLSFQGEAQTVMTNDGYEFPMFTD